MPPTSDGEDGARGRTIAVCLTKLLVDAPASLPIIESAVQRVHRVVLHATEAIAFLMLEDIEAGVAGTDLLPIGDHGMVNSMFNGVVDKTTARRGTPNHAAQQRVRSAFLRIHGPGGSLVEAKGLSQLLASESRYYIATLKTGLSRHFRKRVQRYCKLKLRLSDSEYAKLSKEERKQHTKRILLANTDVCRPGWQHKVSDDADAAFVRQTRTMLGLEQMEWTPLRKSGGTLKKTLTDLIKANPQRFLPGMASLNRAFADAGERTFRLVPMRSSLAPRFITIDQQALSQLGLVGKDTRVSTQKDALQRRREQKV